MSVFIDQREAFPSTILGGSATLSNVNVREFIGTTAQLTQLINTQSTILSYADATFLIGMLGVSSVPLVFLLRKPRKAQQAVEVSE